MLFNSTQFLLFFPVVVLVYYTIPDRIKYLWLLAASYYFYMCWNAKYALLLLFSTAVTWLSGVALGLVRDHLTAAHRDAARKCIVAASVLLNLGVLFFFKYYNFAAGMLASVLARLHIALTIPAFDVLLPVGISFYTFQALSYTMDVYRGDIGPEKNFFRYALFVSFFPQLVAGPIERSKNLLKQLAEPRPFDFDAARDGFLLMLWGYFLKIVVADRIAVFVDTVYGNVYGGFYVVVAAALFAVQIYCDFGGYSTIAMGAAQILGVRLMENFNAPYLATSVTDFWQRWHISLTSWFRDYLYMPLAMADTERLTGGRLRHLPAPLCHMLVFLCSGLWHGAAWNYVAWGGLNGLYIIVGNATRKARRRLYRRCGIDRGRPLWRAGGCACTFLLVAFSLVFFRARGMHHALAVIGRMLTTWNPQILVNGSLFACGLDAPEFVLLLLCIALLFGVDQCRQHGICVRAVILRQRYWVRCTVIAVSIAAILLFGLWGPGYSAANFIYFQF